MNAELKTQYIEIDNENAVKLLSFDELEKLNKQFSDDKRYISSVILQAITSEINEYCPFFWRALDNAQFKEWQELQMLFVNNEVNESVAFLISPAVWEAFYYIIQDIRSGEESRIDPQRYLTEQHCIACGTDDVYNDSYFTICRSCREKYYRKNRDAASV